MLGLRFIVQIVPVVSGHCKQWKQSLVSIESNQLCQQLVGRGRQCFTVDDRLLQYNTVV